MSSDAEVSQCTQFLPASYTIQSTLAHLSQPDNRVYLRANGSGINKSIGRLPGDPGILPDGCVLLPSGEILLPYKLDSNKECEGRDRLTGCKDGGSSESVYKAAITYAVPDNFQGVLYVPIDHSTASPSVAKAETKSTFSSPAGKSTPIQVSPRRASFSNSYHSYRPRGQSDANSDHKGHRKVEQDKMQSREATV